MRKLLLTVLAALGFASTNHATLAQMYNYDIAAYTCIYDGRELVYISLPNGRITEIYDIRNGRVEAGYSAALGGAWTPARFTQVMQNALYPGQTWVSDGNLN